MFELPIAAVIYCTLVAIVFLTLWLWYDGRDHQMTDSELDVGMGRVDRPDRRRGDGLNCCAHSHCAFS